MSNRKKRFIPFSWQPASWGLQGPAREEAEAAYYYEGYELDLRIAEIRNRDDKNALALAFSRIDHKHGKLTDYEHARAVAMIKNRDSGDVVTTMALAAIDHKYGKITDYDLECIRIEHDPALRKDHDARLKAYLTAKFDHGLIDAHTCDTEWAKIDYQDGDELALALLDIEERHGKITAYERDSRSILIEYPEAGADRELARLDVEHRHGKLNELAYQKARATLMEEPWVGIVDSGFDSNRGLDGVYFEFDWNEYWITFLRLNGYYGATDEVVVDQWFSDVCRAQGMASEPPLDGSVVPFSGRVLNRMPDE